MNFIPKIVLKNQGQYQLTVIYTRRRLKAMMTFFLSWFLSTFRMYLVCNVSIFRVFFFTPPQMWLCSPLLQLLTGRLEESLTSIFFSEIRRNKSSRSFLRWKTFNYSLPFWKRCTWLYMGMNRHIFLSWSVFVKVVIELPRNIKCNDVSYLCCPARWQACHSSLLVPGFPAFSVGLWQPDRGQGYSWEESCRVPAICEILSASLF